MRVMRSSASRTVLGFRGRRWRVVSLVRRGSEGPASITPGCEVPGRLTGRPGTKAFASARRLLSPDASSLSSAGSFFVNCPPKGRADGKNDPPLLALCLAVEPFAGDSKVVGCSSFLPLAPCLPPLLPPLWEPEVVPSPCLWCPECVFVDLEPEAVETSAVGPSDEPFPIDSVDAFGSSFGLLAGLRLRFRFWSWFCVGCCDCVVVVAGCGVTSAMFA